MFKHTKGRYIITSVDFKLDTHGTVNIEYRDLKEYFASPQSPLKGGAVPSLQQVREAVIDIRRNKLPDWKVWGTAGSFFKNPIVTEQKYDELKKNYPDIPGFIERDSRGSPSGNIKIPLGWILDHVCHAKGMCKGSVCVYEKQALVLVAKQGAKAVEVMELARELMAQVKEKTGIDIEGEVEWVV